MGLQEIKNSMKYIYRSHMGGIYVANEKLSGKQLYCEDCGDSDEYLGCATNDKEAWKILEPLTCYGDNNGGFLLLYIMNFIEEYFFSEDGMYIHLNAYTVDRNNNMYRFTRSDDVEELPISYCPFEELKEYVIKALFNYVGYFSDMLYMIGSEFKGFSELNKSVLGYKVLIGTYIVHIKDREDDLELTSGIEFNKAVYINDGYYGFIGEDALEHDEYVKVGPFVRYVLEKGIV